MNFQLYKPVRDKDSRIRVKLTSQNAQMNFQLYKPVRDKDEDEQFVVTSFGLNLTKMASVSDLRCSVNLTTNFTFNSSCPQPPQILLPNPFDEFHKFAFGTAIYMILVSFISIIANSLLLLVFFFDPLQIFRNATTYFLVGLAIVDILSAATQEPMYATCFIMMYTKHRDTITTCPTLLSVGYTISLATLNASFLIVLAFTITQYIVVVSPLNYARKVTRRRVIICVSVIYIYAILFSVSHFMGVPLDIKEKYDKIFHNFVLTYLTIIFFILLYVAFTRKMATAKNLREDNNNRQVGIERKFIIVNLLLIGIMFFCCQPIAILSVLLAQLMLDPGNPTTHIILIMVDNLVYLKLLLNPFVYAWRIPKYRQALKIVLRCGEEEPEPRSKFSNRVRAEMSKSRDTVITLDFKSISQG